MTTPNFWDNIAIYSLQSEVALLDAAGRKVLDLEPGANDLRALAPVVYFIRMELGIRGVGLGKAQKVVLTE
jgi:hypothetical protein